MKRNFSKAVGAGVLTLSMAILPFTVSASAQNTTDTGTTTAPATTTDTVRTDAATNRDNGFDWGWLGLLGLLGLGGLAGRKNNEEPARYRDPNAVGGTTYRE